MTEPSIRSFTTAEASEELLREIRLLMDEGFEGEFTDDDWAHTIGGRHVIVGEEGVLVAHASIVARIIEVGGRPFRTGYVEGVATRPAEHGRGLGSLAMTEIARLIRPSFEMGALATDRQTFYERLGWERWHGPTFARRGSERIRTEEEDGAVMVLRFGPSEHVDLAETISCEARPGDDW